MSVVFVVVTGPPAAGKSTLASALAREMRLPLLAKDAIKDVLLETLGAGDVEESRRLGRAAVAVVLRLAAEIDEGVIDSVWVDPHVGVPKLRALHGPVVEVFCCCARELLEERYERRALTKGAGHFDLDRPASELWNWQSLRPLDGGWPVITVDTSKKVDMCALIAEVQAGQDQQPHSPV